MIRYNGKTYENFAQFAKSYQNRYLKANFEKVDFELTKAVDDLTKEDVKEEGVYQIKGYKFFMTKIFENTYTEISANGNEKNCNSFQIMYLEKPNKKGDRAIKINDSSQLTRTVGAMCGENPSGIVCKGKKAKKGFQSATPDNISEQKEKLNALLASLDALKEVADVSPLIGQIRQAVRNVWATQLKELRQADAKASALEKLSGLSASEIANLMKLIKK